MADHTATPTLRDLLEDVAAGRIEPDLAAAVLAGADPGVGTSSRPGTSHTTPPPRPTRIELLVDAVDLRVIADATVDRIEVDGDLSVTERPDGVIEVRLPTRTATGDSYRFGAVGGLMANWLSSQHFRATVRAHPDVPLSVATTASRLDVQGFVGGLNVRAVASNVRIDEARGPLALDLQTSAAKVGVLLDHGQSTVRGTMSSLELTLLPKSDVAITMAAEMGSAKISGRKGSSSKLGEGSEATVGAGVGLLDLAMTMSSAKVALP